jgi:hypothetical protein
MENKNPTHDEIANLINGLSLVMETLDLSTAPHPHVKKSQAIISSILNQAKKEIENAQRPVEETNSNK